MTQYLIVVPDDDAREAMSPVGRAARASRRHDDVAAAAATDRTGS